MNALRKLQQQETHSSPCSTFSGANQPQLPKLMLINSPSIRLPIPTFHSLTFHDYPPPIITIFLCCNITRQFLSGLPVKYYQLSDFQTNQEAMSASYTRKKIQHYSYGLNDVIGKGYSSHVYKGRNDDTSQPVAVKVIDLKMLKNDINRILLDSEIEVLKELKTMDHILTLHDVFTTKNNTYIITELCDSDLSKVVKKGLSEEQATQYMQQILQGYLNFAKNNIIHRDLKPANILMSDGELKIADFGFAIKVSEALKSNKYNVGSPLYMAPESLRRNEYTLKTDIWALGIIFYEMLTGETPWKAKNQKELLRKIENQKIDDLLPKLQISNTSKDFLKRTLKLDKAARLSLQGLMDYSFSSGSENILMEKKLNIDLRANCSNSYNFHAFTPKTEKAEHRRITQRSSQNRQNTKEYSQNKFISFKNDSINQSLQLKSSLNPKLTPTNQAKENPEHNTSTNRNITPLTTQENKYEKRVISKILVSEIHYCRFLYKLLSKIIESSKNGLLQHSRSEVDAITTSYIGIIKHKIDNLMSFPTHNYINAPFYEEYKQSPDFQKLIRIAREYKERYSNQLSSYWDYAKCSFTTDSTMNLISHLHKLLDLRNHHDDLIKKNQKQIIILDYLITSKQLIDILKNGENFERFARKSRIEEIVEGKTADISKELLEKIMRRAKELIQYLPEPEFTLQQRATLLLA